MPRSGDSSVWTELETISVLRTAALHSPAWTKSISAANEICKRRRQLGPLEKSPRKIQRQRKRNYFNSCLPHQRRDVPYRQAGTKFTPYLATRSGGT